MKTERTIIMKKALTLLNEYGTLHSIDFKFVGNNNPTSYAHFSNNASSMLSALKSAQDQGELEKYFEGFGGKEKFTYDIATKLQDDISQVYIQFNKEMTAAGNKGQVLPFSVNMMLLLKNKTMV